MGGPVIMRRLMLITLTLGLVAGQSTKLRYLVASPAVMPYPSNQTTCVYVMSPEASATLTISLTAKKGSVVFNHLIRKGEGPMHCKTFQVPPPMDGKEEIATLAIDITTDGFKKLDKKFVQISMMRNGMFIQTDRLIYQPGETMFIKGVDFDERLIARNDAFPLVTFKDSQGNTVKQWKNVQPRSGIMEASLALSPDIRVGEYTVAATKHGSTVEMPITIDKFVLPKYECTITAAETVTILQSNFPITICGKYTYGKPVIGRITGKMCRSAIFSDEHICEQIDGKTDVNGCYTTEVNTDNFKFKHDGYDNYVNVKASLVEDGSGVEREAAKYIYITDVLGQADFKVPRAYSKNGLDYRGEMSLKGADGLPMSDKDIVLYVDGKRRDEIYTTDRNGIAKFIIKAGDFGDKVLNLRAQYLPRESFTGSGEREPVYEDGYGSLYPSHTSSASQVKIRSEPYVLPCNARLNLWADYVLDPSEYTKKSIDFHCLIISNGKIVSTSTKKHTIAANGGLRSFFPFPVTVTSDMPPAATFLIYAGLENGEIIADSIKFPVMSCFPNSVSLQFSDEPSLPGSMVNLHISAYPNSVCNIRAVDQSIELLKAEKERSEDSVNEFLKDWEATKNRYPLALEELQTCPVGSFPAFVQSPNLPDIYSNFEKSGIKVITNFNIRKPLDCKSLSEGSMNIMAIPERHIEEFHPIILQPRPPPPRINVRRRFPNTWLMNTKPIGETGELDYPIRVPDTITRWNVDAFCTSTIGLGFSPRIEYQVFKPFFVELHMPYSVKQGETLVLKADVLNYMKQCIKVSVTLYKSKDFQLLPCTGCSYSVCLCSNPTFTFTWNIKPLTLGAINITIGTEALNTNDLCDGQRPIVPTSGKSDIVQKRLIVEAHGIPVENTRSLILCAPNSETIPLQLPNNVVLGSQSAVVTVTGDVMGKPLNNLNNLVQLPTGCGEQNMIYLAPIIKIYNYMIATGQMTTEFSTKAIEYMETGYQNQLQFKHSDGSYSAFGSSDPSGSTWLTAFVVLVFFECQEVIGIDYEHIKESLDWLEKQQQSNGCFRNVGRVIHLELLGGVDSETALSAYVTTTFVAVNDPKYNHVIEKAKKCLQSCTAAQSSVFTKAQCAYTYTLLGDKVKRTQLLKQLDEVAIKNDDKVHWSTKPESTNPEPFWAQSNSAAVETTAYVVMALVYGNDLAVALLAIRWIYSKQNANGGFCSTQDTVVALSAISAYSSKTFANQNVPTIGITNNKGFKVDVILNPTRLFEVHVVALRENPAVYTLKASGSGCAYVQITQRYNIQNPEPEGTFLLQVKTSSIQCPPHPVPSFTIEVSVSLSDASNEKRTNMALVEIKPISGFVPNSDTVDKLLINDEVKRVENKPTGVTIYLEKITSTPMILSIDMEQQCEVQGLHAAVVSVTDYYEPLKHVKKTYRNPCK